MITENSKAHSAQEDTWADNALTWDRAGKPFLVLFYCVFITASESYQH